MAQALGHRHRRDVYNTFFATPFTLDGQILDFRCWEQPKHRMLAAYRAKKAPLVRFGFIPLRLFLQFFSPRFLFPHQRKDQIKNPCQYRIKRYMAQALRRRRIQNGSNSLLNSGGVKSVRDLVCCYLVDSGLVKTAVSDRLEETAIFPRIDLTYIIRIMWYASSARTYVYRIIHSLSPLVNSQIVENLFICNTFFVQSYKKAA